MPSRGTQSPRPFRPPPRIRCKLSRRQVVAQAPNLLGEGSTGPLFAGNLGPMSEDEVPIDFLCVGEDHLRHGRSVSDGQGHLTVVEQKWAYCPAGLEDEPHHWRAINGMTLAGIRHADL